jgi:hypothetical protein
MFDAQCVKLWEGRTWLPEDQIRVVSIIDASKLSNGHIDAWGSTGSWSVRRSATMRCSPRRFSATT